MTNLTLLVFENDWCVQCYTERRVIHKLGTAYGDQLKVRFINADKEQELAQHYKVLSAPSMVLIKNGEAVERIPRFIDQTQLASVIRYYQ